MAKCKCGTRPRIVSDVVRSMKKNGNCRDVCANPICGDPNMLGIFAPLIYDEIGINLCTSFAIGIDVAAEYPTAVTASVRVIRAVYAYGGTGVTIEAITGRPNCYVVTLSNLTVEFALNLYDSACRLVGTVYPSAVYLPSDTASDTYDADTNPGSVELELFAPYGPSCFGDPLSPIINYIGMTSENNSLRQGINLYSMAKLLDFSADDSTVTVGLTLVLQSLYFAGYKVKSAGKIDVPKGSILQADHSDCMRFVAGDLLNLAIKPLDLGAPLCEEQYKQECCSTSNVCGGCGPCGSMGDSTVGKDTCGSPRDGAGIPAKSVCGNAGGIPSGSAGGIPAAGNGSCGDECRNGATDNTVVIQERN